MTRFTLNPTEHQEQKALMEWAKLMEHQIPKLSKLHAIANGGYRHPNTARKMKEEGVKPGVPDLSLPVKTPKYSGLYIEMKKSKGGRVRPEQKIWHAALRDEGFRVDVCAGFEAAKEAIEDYLGGGK